MARKTQLDTVVEQLRQMKEVDPRIEYVGRRTDGGHRRVQLNLAPQLAAELLPAIRAKSGRPAAKRR